MTEQQFDAIKEWMLESVPEVAKRWAPLYRELKWEWNLYPRPMGTPTEADIIHAMNWMIQTHINYPDPLDVRSGGVKVYIEESEGGPQGVMEFADSVYNYREEEEEVVA